MSTHRRNKGTLVVVALVASVLVVGGCTASTRDASDETATTATPATADTGAAVTVDLQASPNDTFGTFGATISGTVRMGGGPLADPATVELNIEIFQVGAVDVMVQTSSGLGRDGTEYPLDPSIAEQIASDLDRTLQDFQATY